MDQEWDSTLSTSTSHARQADGQAVGLEAAMSHPSIPGSSSSVAYDVFCLAVAQSWFKDWPVMAGLAKLTLVSRACVKALLYIKRPNIEVGMTRVANGCCLHLARAGLFMLSQMFTNAPTFAGLCCSFSFVPKSCRIQVTTLFLSSVCRLITANSFIIVRSC